MMRQTPERNPLLPLLPRRREPKKGAYYNKRELKKGKKEKEASFELCDTWSSFFFNAMRGGKGKGWT